MQVATGMTGELFKEKDFIPVRVMAVKAFVEDDKKWKEYIERPSSMIDPIARRLQVDLRGYGWKDGEAEAKPGEEVTRTGFFKVEKEKLEAALQESGLEGGVFLEKLRVNNGYRGPVAWIKRTDRDEPDSDYYARATERAVSAGKTLVFRRGGGASLGVLGENQGPKPTNIG